MNPRALALPLAAIVAVVVLLAVQLASGGTKFVPAKTPSPCVEPALPAASKDLEPLIEAVVLDGVQKAACTLGVSRERLLIALPSPAGRQRLATESGQSEAQLVAALKQGMIVEVRRFDRGGRLPPASTLIDTYASQLGFTGLAAEAVKRVPAELIDGLLPIGGVLERAIAGLDFEALLGQLTDPDSLEPTLRAAIRDAAIAEAKAKLLEQVPDSLRGLLGG